MYWLKSLFLATLIACVALSSWADAQQCFRYRRDGPAECDSLATTADGSIDVYATIWIPPNQTYVSVVNTLIERVRSAQFAPGACKQATLDFVCPTYRIPCLNENPRPLPFPRAVCRNLCDSFVAACADLIRLVGQTPPDCAGSTRQFFGGTYPEFPIGGYNITFNGTEYFVPCNDNNGKNADSNYVDPPLDPNSLPAIDGNNTALDFGEGTIVDNSAECPYPNVKDNGTCWCCGCPDPMYTPTEYLVVTTFFYLGGWLSLISVGMYLATYIVQYLTTKKVKRFPYNIPFYWGWGAIGIAFVVVIESFVGYQGVWCKGRQFSSGQIGDPNFNGMCLFEAIFYHYFIWYQLFWVICLNFTLMHKFVTLKDTMKYYHKWFHIVITPLSTFSIIATAAVGRIGYARGTNLCYINEDFNNPDILFYVKYIYIVPAVIICLLLLAGVLANFALVRRISSTVSSTGGKRARQGEVRLLIFLLVDFLLLSPNLIRYFISISQQGDITSSYGRWVICWADQVNGGNAVLCGATPDIRPHIVWYFFTAFTSSVHGFIVFLVLGLYRDVWTFWSTRWCPWVHKKTGAVHHSQSATAATKSGTKSTSASGSQSRSAELNSVSAN